MLLIFFEIPGSKSKSLSAIIEKNDYKDMYAATPYLTTLTTGTMHLYFRNIKCFFIYIFIIFFKRIVEILSKYKAMLRLILR